MTTVDDLSNYIFEGENPALSAEFEEWVRDSRRFRAFATGYASKIRAKVRNLRDESGKKDLRAELEIAVLLSKSERFTVEYEKYAASKQRGPDFSVTFKTHTHFNVEVRRITNSEFEGQDRDRRLNKLMAVLCDKVGQMPPSIMNLLWLIGDREIAETDLVTAVTTLRQLAERKVEAWFNPRGFSSAEFNKNFTRLSAIVYRQAGAILVWLNPNARHPVPSEIVKAIQRLGGE